MSDEGPIRATMHYKIISGPGDAADELFDTGSELRIHVVDKLPEHISQEILTHPRITFFVPEDDGRVTDVTSSPHVVKGRDASKPMWVLLTHHSYNLQAGEAIQSRPQLVQNRIGSRPSPLRNGDDEVLGADKVVEYVTLQDIYSSREEAKNRATDFYEGNRRASTWVIDQGDFLGHMIIPVDVGDDVRIMPAFAYTGHD